MALSSSSFSRAVIAAIFVSLIGGAVVLNRRNARVTDGVAGAPARPDAMQRYGFSLEEVSRKAGVDFVHHAPTLDPKIGPIQPRVADMGAAVAVADFDHDGWPDFYVTDSGENSKNRLYRNRHDGTFEDVAEAMGVAEVNKDGTGVSMGALFGDFDNDGFEDLLVYKWGRPRLFHNDAGKGFTDITEKANLPGWMNANTALLLDFDGDGKLDILLCGYFDESIDLWHLKSTAIMPDSLEYANNGAPKHLLKGNGDGTFTDVTSAMGMDVKAWTLAAASADLNGDGFAEVFLANDYGYGELWRNDGGKRFVNITADSGIHDKPKSGMNASFGDVDNTGKLSLYVSNIWENTLLMQGNNLWVLKDDAKPGELVFENRANMMSVENGGWSFGAQFGDLNNDGFLDLYLVNGYISSPTDKNNSYWYDYAKFSLGHGAIIRDIANWPAIDGRSLAGYQQKRVWMNDGAGRFNEVAQAVGASDLNDGRAVAMADLWNRGCVDVLVANQRGPFLIYKNSVTPGNAWIGFALEGTKSNRSAIGASVTVYFNGQKQTQVVGGGSGFCAQNDRRLHFGLGSGAKVEKVEIRWPGGTMQTINSPEPGKIHSVKES